ncbi:putative helicase, partial [Cardiosporidium cionae]
FFFLQRHHTFCPFYASREMAEDAHIIFLPYNYLFDPTTRAAMKLNLKGSIIILDEAHNIEQVAEEAASFDLHQMDICRAVNAIAVVLSTLLEKANSSQQNISNSIETSTDGDIPDLRNLLELHKCLTHIDQWMAEVSLSQYFQRLKGPHALFSVKEIFSILE